MGTFFHGGVHIFYLSLEWEQTWHTPSHTVHRCQKNNGREKNSKFLQCASWIGLKIDSVFFKVSHCTSIHD